MENTKEMIGKTIKSVEVIRAEYGRTYSHYTCIVFEDGSKIMLCDATIPYKPNPDQEEMSKAPNYFTPDDIAERVKKDEERKRKKIAEDLYYKKCQLEKLKKELGEI